jgi:CelD/BcsL family acetyltransferase involved in cellulose biosynthesis
MGTITVRCISDVVPFTALRHEWDELLRSSGSDNPFLTWEWLYVWWTQFGSANGLRLIVVRSDGTLIAIAPLRLVTSPLPWLSRLEFLGTGNAGSDYLDLIVRHGCETRALTSITDSLISQRLTVRLSHLPPASLGSQLGQRLTDAGWATAMTDDGVCPIIRLSGHTFDSFLATLGASHRANIRRRLRALERRFDVRFTRIESHEERREMLAALAHFHGRRYQKRGGSTAFSTGGIRAFHQEATRRALDRGWLQMYALRLDGHLAAVMYGFRYGGRFYFYQHGYDEQYSECSVGLVLMALTIRAAIDDGVDEFDMLWGTEPYKALWAQETRVLQRVDLFPLRLGEAMYRRASEARRGVAHLARRVRSLASPGVTRVI